MLAKTADQRLALESVVKTSGGCAVLRLLPKTGPNLSRMCRPLPEVLSYLTCSSSAIAAEAWLDQPAKNLPSLSSSAESNTDVRVAFLTWPSNSLTPASKQAAALCQCVSSAAFTLSTLACRVTSFKIGLVLTSIVPVTSVARGTRSTAIPLCGRQGVPATTLGCCRTSLALSETIQ